MMFDELRKPTKSELYDVSRVAHPMVDYQIKAIRKKLETWLESQGVTRENASEFQLIEFPEDCGIVFRLARHGQPTLFSTRPPTLFATLRIKFQVEVGK